MFGVWDLMAYGFYEGLGILGFGMLRVLGLRYVVVIPKRLHKA